jgi:hypothetical protein
VPSVAPVSRRPRRPSSRRRAARAASVLALVGLAALVATTVAVAAFAARTENPGNTVTAAPDFTPPAITALAIGKSQGGATGFVKQGGTYFVYANVSADTGNPASGLSTVKANVELVTSGQTAVTMTAGTYTAGGVSYNYKSAQLTAGGVLVEGAKKFTVTATDVAGNARTVEGSVTIDNTAPKTADVQSANASGGTVGLMEQNDTLTFTWSEPVEPETILAGWSGAATNVVVGVTDNGLLGLSTGEDTIQIFNATNTASLPLGGTALGNGEYVTGILFGQITFGASGTASKMVMSGNTVTITLGTYGALLSGRATAKAAGLMTWTPTPPEPTVITDRAGNLLSTAAVKQSGAARLEF